MGAYEGVDECESCRIWKVQLFGRRKTGVHQRWSRDCEQSGYSAERGVLYLDYSCCLSPMRRNSVLEELRVNRLAIGVMVVSTSNLAGSTMEKNNENSCWSPNYLSFVENPSRQIKRLCLQNFNQKLIHVNVNVAVSMHAKTLITYRICRQTAHINEVVMITLTACTVSKIAFHPCTLHSHQWQRVWTERLWTTSLWRSLLYGRCGILQPSEKNRQAFHCPAIWAACSFKHFWKDIRHSYFTSVSKLL